jgi:hypothetical protein
MDGSEKGQLRPDVPRNVEAQNKTIQQWLASCETLYCNDKKQNISMSGCVEALTSFNESQDSGFDVTPPPFDQPGRANVEQCQLARGNGKYIGLSGGLNCAP